MNILRSRTIRKSLCLTLSFVLLLSLGSIVAFANDTTKVKHGVLIEETSRGASAPTRVWPVSIGVQPYIGTGSTLYESVYSDYMFTPNGSGNNGNVTFTLSGSMQSGSPATSITVYLYEYNPNGTDPLESSRTFGPGTSWSNVSASTITGLNATKYYYFRIIKNNTSYALTNYSLKCS